jgi:DNA repair exonuclease SbcCD ATPase subunit
MIRSTDYSYINEDLINPLLKCPICSKPFVDPVITPNGNGTRTCRLCNDHQNCVPVTEKLLLDLLDDLQVECTKCKERNIRRGDLEHHKNTTCTQRLVLCKAADLKCSWTGSHEQLDDHLESCSFHLLRPIFTEILADIRQFKEQTNQNRISCDEQQQAEEDRNRNDEFKKEIEELKQQCNRLQNDVQQLKTQNEQVENENLLLKQELNEFKNQFDQLKQLYNQQINENNELQTEIQQLKKQYNQQMSQYEKLSEHIINHNKQSFQQQTQNDEIISIKQLVNQHDVQIKLLARKKCVIPGKSIIELYSFYPYIIF